MDSRTYRDFVLDIYQAVPEPLLWPSILDRLSDTFRARGCIIFEWQLVGDERRLETTWFTSGYESDILENYLRRNRVWEEQDQDIYERQLLTIDGIEVISEDILYDEETDYLARPHVKELTEYGIRHRTGSLLDKDNPYRSRFSLQLSESRGPLNAEDARDLGDLLPHVAKAMDVGRPMVSPGFEKMALLTLMELLHVGICILDQHARVAHTNAEFDRQVEAYGVFRVSREGLLQLDPRVDQEQYRRLVRDAMNHGKCGARPRKEAITIASDDDTSALCVEIVPVHQLQEIGSKPFGGTILISRDTTTAFRIDLDLIRQVYSDLTNAELAVIDLICHGLTNSEIAERRDRSIETVNVQVKAILGKSRAANRTQLVRLLGNFSL